MTENEAIKHLELCKTSRLFIPNNDVLEVAIQALEEIQQYRAIGTVEEFKALKEKIAKIEFILNEKNYIEADECDYGNYYTCENALMIKDIEEIINS